MRSALPLSARVVAALLILTAPAAAATVYVAPSGNDQNDGSITAPLATPARALALAGPGDTVLLRAGSYAISQQLQIRQTGLTLQSYPGEVAQLVAPTTDTAGVNSLIVVYAGHVTVANLELQGAAYYGIKLDDYYGPQPGITLRNLYIHHTGRDGIKVQRADSVRIEDNEVAFTGVRDASNAEGIDVMGAVGATIRGNHVHDIATTGIYVKAGTRQAAVEANRVERTGYSGILIGSESLAQYMRDGAVYEAIDSHARNNIVVDATLTGLGSVAGDNIRFENNTVINAARSGQAVFRTAPNEYGTQTRNVTLRNNIFVLTPGSTRPMVQLYFYSGPITSDNNLWFSADGRYGFWRESSTGSSFWNSLAQWQMGMNADWSSRTDDPLLDATALYRPLAGSPTVDSGMGIYEVTADFSGIARPQGLGYEMGAHERVEPVAAPAPTLREPTPTQPAPAPEPVAPPSAPASLTATQTSRASVALKWSDTSTNEQGFRIERSINGAAFTTLSSVAAGAVTFTDTAAKMGKTYGYRVVAFNDGGASAASNIASVTIRK